MTLRAFLFKYFCTYIRLKVHTVISLAVLRNDITDNIGIITHHFFSNLPFSTDIMNINRTVICYSKDSAFNSSLNQKRS